MDAVCFKLELHYTRGSTPKRVTSGGVGLAFSNIAPKKRRSSGEPLATLSDLASSEIEPPGIRTNSDVFNYYNKFYVTKTFRVK